MSTLAVEFVFVATLECTFFSCFTSQLGAVHAFISCSAPAAGVLLQYSFLAPHPPLLLSALCCFTAPCVWNLFSVTSYRAHDLFFASVSFPCPFPCKFLACVRFFAFFPFSLRLGVIVRRHFSFRFSRMLVLPVFSLLVILLCPCALTFHPFSH